MARNFGSLTTSVEVALVAATEKAVLMLTGPSTIMIALQGIELSFDSTSSTAEPVIVRIVRASTTGTFTARTPEQTKVKTQALVSTGGENASAEPTTSAILKTFHVHPQAGVVYPFQLPDGEVESSGGGRLALKVTAPAGVNCLATMNFEE
jgi:hypothetical protein